MAIEFRYDTEPLLEWVQSRYDNNAIDGNTHALGIELDGQLVAVAMYNGFTNTSCAIHIVSDGGRRWALRSFLEVAFHYPFVQMGLNRVTAYVPASNIDALILDLRLGFQIEGTMREGTEGDDLVVMGMLRRNCKWINEDERHGR